MAVLLAPQAVGLAALAGLPPEQGVYAAALAPIVSSLTSSSVYLQAGPTAMTSLLTLGALTAVAMPGTPSYVALAALLALMVGVVRIVVGLLRAGGISYLMSQPVVAGFTAAAGVLIVLSQVPAVLGVRATDDNPILAAWDALVDPAAWQALAPIVAIGTLVVILGGKRLHPLFPGVLIAAVGGIAIASIADVPTVGTVSSGLPPLTTSLPWAEVPGLLVPAIVIAVIGFAEPAAIARHFAAAERTVWSPSREFVSQGLANIAAGLGSGYPVGGSFSRSALNKLAGAESRWSGLIVGATVLAFTPFMGVLGSLPRAVVGATVIAAALSLVSLRPFLEFGRIAHVQLAVGGATFVVTMVFAPHVEYGVLVGVALAIAAHLWREIRLSVPTRIDGSALHVLPRGVLYYASAPGVGDTVTALLARHRDVDKLVIHLDGLGRVDLTGALVLRDLVVDATSAGIEVRVVNVPPQAAKVITRTLGDLVPVELLPGS